MYLYIIFAFLAVLSFMELAGIRIKQLPSFYSYSFWGCIFVFIFLSTFRWENGTDWESYYFYFDYLDGITCMGYMEPGFTLLTSVNSNLFNYTIQLASVAFLSIIPIAWRYKKISPYPLFSLFIWYSTLFAHIFPVRQSIAIALFVFSWKYIEEKRFIIFGIIILLAATFHLTALITIPVYFIWHRKFSVRFYLYIIVVLIVLSLASETLISGVLYTLGGDFLKSKLEFYLEENADSTFGSAYSVTQILVRGIINRSLFFFLPLYLLNSIREKDKTLNAFFNLYFYSFALFLLVTPLAPALGRLCTYTDMVQALLIPCVFYLKMDKANFYLIISILILYFAVRFQGIVLNYYDLYIPYNFVFFR